MDSKQKRRQFLKHGAIAGSGLAFAGLMPSAAAQTGDEDDRSAEFFGIVQTRRSVRKYKSTPIPDEHITRMLDAARLAPTAGNQQPWKFIVVKDRAKLDTLKKKCIEKNLQMLEERDGSVESAKLEKLTKHYEGYFSAPVYIVVLTDNGSKYPDYNEKDGALAAGYLMLAARALGYGTVFCTDTIPEDITREVLGIPDKYTRICITPVGVPESWPESPKKNDLDELIVRESF